MNTEIVPAVITAVAPEGYYRFIQITNPFEPHKHTDSFVEWQEGQTIAEALGDLVDPNNTVVVLNGGPVPAEMWDKYVIPEQSSLAICVVPEGGDAKDILRMVLVIVVAIFAWYIGGPALAGAEVGSMSSAAYAAGIMIAGSLVINALLPPSVPTFGSDDMSDSATYGIDGAKNTSREGVKVPVAYGMFRMAGNIINMHVRNVGNDQYLYMLVNAGEGQVAGISDIYINDQPASNYQNVETQIRLGTRDQDPIEWFQISEAHVSRGITLNTSYTTYTGTNDIDAFRLDFTAPTGIWGMNDKGVRHTETVTLGVEYRKVGTTAWTALIPSTEVVSYETAYFYFGFNSYDYWGSGTGYTADVESTSLISGDTVEGSLIMRDGVQVGYVGQSVTYGGSLSVTVNQTSPYRWSVYSPKLELGKYEVRILRTNPESLEDKKRDRVVWTDFVEIVTDKVAYRNTALVGVKIKLTDQLSSVPTISYVNHGRVIKYFDGTQWRDGNSANPAWIAYDMLTNPRYGAGVDESRLDIDRWKEWAAYCDSVNLTFNGVFDTALSVWDSLQVVLRAGHARVLRVGTRYSVAIEMPASPTMMFGVGNIVSGTFQQMWGGIESRANAVEVTYFDKEDNYRQHTINVYDSTVNLDATQNTAAITLYGVVDADRATKEAIFQLKLNRYIKTTCTFEAPLEAISCTVGDVVLIQHDQPDWGYGGRLETGSTTTTVNLDRPVVLAAGKTYKLLVHYSALQKLSGSVTSVASTTISLSGYSGQTDIDRIVIGGQDYQVVGFHAAGVLVDDATGISVGESYVAYKTDAIETRTVTSAAGTHSTVTVSSAFPSAPPQYANFMLGENAQVTKAWRIISLEFGSSDLTRKVSCFEYAPEVYDWTNTTGATIQPGDNYDSAVPNVTDLAAAEYAEPSGSSVQNKVSVSWVAPDGYTDYDGADIYVARASEPYQLAGSVRNSATSFTFLVDTGVAYTIKVQTHTVDGRFAVLSACPTTNITISGDTVAPAAPTGVTLTVPQVGINIAFVPPADADYIGCEVYRNTANSTGTTTKIFTTDATQTSFVDVGATDPSVAYYYWLRSRDFNGNLSAFTPSTPTFASPKGSTITGFLTNESHLVAADSSGVVSDFTGAGGTFKVFEGTVDVTTSAAFTEVSETSCTGTINATTGVYAITAMTADVASYTIRATYKGVSIDKIFSLAKSRTGAAGTGTNAKLLSLSADAQAFTYGSDGNASPSSQTITFTAVRQNISTTTVWTTTPVVTLGGSGDTRTLSLANFGANTAVKIHAEADGLYDEITIVKLSDGRAALYGRLSNDTVALSADSSGTVASFTPAAGYFQVFSGTTDVTADCTFSVAAQTSVTGEINTATNNPVNGFAKGYYRVTAMSADTGTLTVRAVYSGTTIDRTFVVSKAKAGLAGSNAKTISMRSDKQTFTFNGSNALNPSGQVIKFDVDKQNTTNAVAWTTSPVVDLYDAATGGAKTTAGNTVYLRAADFSTNTAVTVTATVTDGSTLTDSITVIKVKDGTGGTDAVTGLLTNESHLLAAANDGTGYSLTGSGGTFRVYSGTTEVTTGNSVTYAVSGSATKNGLTIAINGTTGVYSLSGASWTTDSETFTLSAVYGTATITKDYKISKSKAGAAGSDAVAYEIESSVAAVSKSGSTYTPTSITYSAYKTTGTGSRTAYSGRFIIATTTDNSTWTDAYTSSADESSKAYTVPASVIGVRATLYLAGGVTTVLSRKIVPIIVNGTNGTNGNNVAQVYAYKRASSAPSDNPGDVTFDFTTGAISTVSLANSWLKAIPTGTAPLYVTVASAVGSGSTDTIAAAEWSTPVLLVQNGVDGTNGINVATVFLYKRTANSTAPALDTAGTATYTFASGAITSQPTGWSTSVPSATNGGFLWMVQATASSGGTTDTIANTEWSTPTLITQDGAAGANAITIDLSSDTISVPAASDGSNPVLTNAVTTVYVYNGTADDSANWTITATPSSGVAGSLATRTYTVTGLTVDSGYVDFTATRTNYATQTIRYNITKVKAASNGADAVVYEVEPSVSAIKKTSGGAYVPTSITYSAYSTTGTSARTAYSGRFIIATTTDGTTYTNQYTSAADESSKAYTIPAGVVGVRARLYLAGGTTTLVDQELQPVIADGTSATSPTTAYLTVPTVSLMAYADGSVASFTPAAGNIKVFSGTTDVTGSATFAVTTQTNCTGSVSAAGAYSVTAMTADTASLEMTATYSGTTITLTFALSKSKIGFEIVSAFPTSGNFTGRMVFRTTDKKLYRYDGSAFIAEVPAADITGTVNASQIADAAISAAKLNVSIGGGNLLSNSGFEAASLTGLSKVGTGITESVSTTQKHSGAKSMKLVGTVGGADTYMLFSLSNPLPNTKYVFSAWVYVESISAAAIGNRSILSYDGVAASASDSTLTTSHPIGVWTRKVITMTTSASPSVLELRMYAPVGVVYWDDAQIEIGDVATAYAPRPDEILAGTITETEIADDAVKSPKIYAGAVVAGKIAAGAVTASKLAVVGGSTTVNTDPQFTDTAAWTLGSNIAFGTGTTVSGAVGSTYASCSTGTDKTATTVTSFPISPTKVYRLSASLYAATGNTRNMYLFVQFYDAAGAYVSGASTGWGGTMSGYTYGGTPTAGSFNVYGDTFGAGTARTIPSNVRYCTIGVWFQYSGNGSSQVEQAATNLRLEEVIPGELIVDGAITANKIYAGAVTAGKIAAGAITAESLSVASFSDSAIMNGSFEDASSTDSTLPAGWERNTTWGGTNTTAIRSLEGGSSGVACLKLSPGAGNAADMRAKLVPVVPGDVWYMSFWALSGGTNAGTSLGFYARIRGGATSTANTHEAYMGVENTSVPSGVWTFYEGQITIPTGMTWAAPIFLNYSTNTGHSVYVDDVVFRKVIGGVQIKDGAITAAKIKAGDITADRINVGNLVGAFVGANQITAANIDSRSLSIKDAAGNVIFSAGTPLTSSYITPAAGWLNSNVTLSSIGYTGAPDANKTYVDSSGKIQGVSSGAGTVIDNSYATIGQNLIPNSDQTSAFTWSGISYNPGGATFDSLPQYASTTWDTTTYVLQGSTTRNIWFHQSGIIAGGDSAVAGDIIMNDGAGAALKIPVIPGERYVASAYIANHRCAGQVYIGFFDSSDAIISYSVSNAVGPTNNYANQLATPYYNRAYTAATAPAGASTVRFWVRKLNTITGNGDSYIWVAAPQFERVNANVSTPSPYQPGPVSSTRQLGYSGDLAATKNIITYATTAPASPTDGDVWVDTSAAPVVVKVRVSGAWQVGGNYTTNTNQLTDGAGLGTTATWSNVTGTGKPADGATKNTVYRQSSAPTSGMSTSDIWFDTTNFATYYYNGSSWVLAGDKTSSNTAAAITGQGTFATTSQITSGNSGSLVGSNAITSTHIASLAVGPISSAVNGNTSSGGRVTIDAGNGGRIQIYDSSNVLRMKIGYLL